MKKVTVRIKRRAKKYCFRKLIIKNVFWKILY